MLKKCKIKYDLVLNVIVFLTLYKRAYKIYAPVS